jgi:hypothetical protein
VLQAVIIRRASWAAAATSGVSFRRQDFPRDLDGFDIDDSFMAPSLRPAGRNALDPDPGVQPLPDGWEEQKKTQKIAEEAGNEKQQPGHDPRHRLARRPPLQG